MGLFEEVGKNKNLVYVDDNDHGREYFFNELPFLKIEESKTKQLAFLYLDNSLQAVTVFWSYMRSNNALALLSPNLSGDFKTELENLYKPHYIYDPTRAEIENYDSSVNNGLNIHTFPVSHPTNINGKIKVLLSTSGTTGSPKFVKLSEENLLANADSIIDYLPIRKDDVTPLNLPVFYSYGLSILTTNSLVGGKVVCGGIDVLSRTFWPKMSSYGYTSIAGVPFVYEMLDRIGFRKSTYPSLRYFTVAGGKLEQSILKNFAEYAHNHNVSFFVMYGQTEATARMSYLPPVKLLEKTGSIGIPIKNGVFELEHETGELCYHGPNVFGGYVSEPADLATYEQPGFLHTGDLARVDADGYYYIMGRLKRFVKLFGNRVNLDEVEAIAATYSGSIVRCVGVNDKALVMALTDNTIDANTLMSYVSEKTKIHHSVLKIVFMDEYPLSQNGKVDYNKIVDLHEAK